MRLCVLSILVAMAIVAVATPVHAGEVQPVSPINSTADAMLDDSLTSVMVRPRSEQKAEGRREFSKRKPDAAMTENGDESIMARGEQQSKKIASSSPVSWKGMASLGVVLGLIAATYLLTKRFVPQLHVADSHAVRIVSRTVLSPKQTLVLLRLPRRFLLVGVSSDRMDVIADMTDGEEVADLVQRCDHKRPAQPDDANSAGRFAHILDRESAGFAESADRAAYHPNEPSVDAGQVAAGLKQLAERLQTLQKKS